MPECNGGFKLTLVYERWWPGAREDREQPEIADRLFDLYEHAQFARSDRSDPLQVAEAPGLHQALQSRSHTETDPTDQMMS